MLYNLSKIDDNILLKKLILKKNSTTRSKNNYIIKNKTFSDLHKYKTQIMINLRTIIILELI